MSWCRDAPLPRARARWRWRARGCRVHSRAREADTLTPQTPTPKIDGAPVFAGAPMLRRRVASGRRLDGYGRTVSKSDYTRRTFATLPTAESHGRSPPQDYGGPKRCRPGSKVATRALVGNHPGATVPPLPSRGRLPRRDRLSSRLRVTAAAPLGSGYPMVFPMGGGRSATSTRPRASLAGTFLVGRGGKGEDMARVRTGD